MDDLISLFEDFLGMAIHTSSWKGEQALPIYLFYGHEFLVAEICGIRYLLVKLLLQDHRGIRGMKKDKQKLESISGMDVLFVLDDITRVERDALIRARIEFLSLPDQVYMPSLGLLLKNRRARKSMPVVSETFTASAQMLYLLMQYQHEQEWSRNEAAERLNMPPTTMTHAAAQLEAAGLIRSRRVGRTVYMSAVSQGYDYYEKAKPYLMNPVQKSFFIAASERTAGGILAGEAVLSDRSDLSCPGYLIYAFNKKDDRLKSFKAIDSRWQNDEERILVEVWRYDPALFAEEDGADAVSVACSLSGIYDERLEGAVLQMLHERLR